MNDTGVNVLLGALGLLAAGAFAALALLTRSVRVSRGALWLALLAPFVIGVQRTRADVGALTQGGLGIVDGARFAVPAALLVVGLCVHGPVRRGIGFVEAAAAGFIAFACVSALWSHFPLASLAKALALGLQYCTVWCLVRRYRSVSEVFTSVATVISLLMGSVLVGAVVFYRSAFVPIAGDNLVRLRGYILPLHPNMIGIVGGIGLIGLVCGFKPRWASSSFLVAMLGSIYFIELVLAKSRLALAISIGLVGLGLLVLRVRRSAGVIVLCLGLAVSIVVFPSASSGLFGYAARGQSQKELVSLTGRTELWSVALDVSARRPLLGYGYYVGHRLVVPQPKGQGDTSNVDNMWVESLVDLGMVGVAMLAALVFAGVFRLSGASRKAGRAAHTFALLSSCLLILATLFNPSIQTQGYASAIFLLLLFSPVGSSWRAEQEDVLVRCLEDDHTYASVRNAV